MRWLSASIRSRSQARSTRALASSADVDQAQASDAAQAASSETAAMRRHQVVNQAITRRSTRSRPFLCRQLRQRQPTRVLQMGVFPKSAGPPARPLEAQRFADLAALVEQR